MVERATEKRRRKNADLIVVNDVSADGVGFDHETNAVTLIFRDEPSVTVSLRSKEAVAYEILASVSSLLS